MKREEKYKVRFDEMLQYEREFYKKGIRFIAGVDEVGRGPLAGPVVAAAVVLPENFNILGIDDSKKLSEKRREELYPLIKREAISYAIGMVNHNKIDEINILEATKIAMRGAILSLNAKLEKKEGEGIGQVLIDAISLNDISLPQKSIVKGDSKSVSIAAASILAKVTRDNLMKEYDKEYPGYEFSSNKGYGTRGHYDGLRELGISPIHRKTFLKKLFKKGD